MGELDARLVAIQKLCESPDAYCVCLHGIAVLIFPDKAQALLEANDLGAEYTTRPATLSERNRYKGE